uniref:EB domain-containing protein n=1 Tax=Anopheles atroparvus TaxID=41427 RepID=A0A182IIY6_ANOAO
MIVSFFPDSVWGCTVKQHQKQKHLLYHKIIYALISDKYKNRNLRKSSFALLYLSYVFIKMLPVTLAIESHTGTKAITSLTAKPRAVPDLVAPPLGDEDDDYIDDYVDEYDIVNNKSAKGRYIGAPCEFTCHSTLHHVYCDPTTNTCTCEKDYAVVIGILKGCAKPKKLGEQCFYDETCIFNDEHALCQQIVHNAICQCAPGFHSVSYSKPKKRVFCTQVGKTVISFQSALERLHRFLWQSAVVQCAAARLQRGPGLDLPYRNSQSTSNDSQHPSSYLSDDNMTRYLERQLEHQKQLLYLDIPSLRTHNKLFTKFCKATALIGGGGGGGGSQQQQQRQAGGSSSCDDEHGGTYGSIAGHPGSRYAGASANDDSSFDDDDDQGGGGGYDGRGTGDPGYANHYYSYDPLDSIELGALPTPASEVANVAVPEDPV